MKAVFRNKISQCMIVFVVMINSTGLVYSSQTTLRVAVASNFSIAFKRLSAEFEKQTGLTVLVSQASTGKLYAQIVHGAPYDIFFAADEKRPDLLVEKGRAYNAMVYATGQLVFVAKDHTIANCKSALDNNSLAKLSIANPKTAPYGLAAKEALLSLGKWDKLKPRLVMGENILQAFQFITTGNSMMGFVAKSLLVNSEALSGYCQWQLPTTLYHPIKQKLVVLKRADNLRAVQALLSFIRSATAKKIIKENGYLVE